MKKQSKKASKHTSKSNYLQTKRAKKIKGKSVKVGGTVTIKGKGKKLLKFKKGSLKEDLGVPQKEKIPESKMKSAETGRYGKKIKKKALFDENVLEAGRKTVATKRRVKK